MEYARFADDLVILVDAWPRQQWRREAVEQRLREEFAKRQVEVNEDKSRKWIYSETKASDFWVLNSVVSGVSRDDGCRCYCRKARSERHC